MDARIMEVRTFLRHYLKKPLVRFLLSAHTISRMVSGIFSFIVCGSIMSGGFQNLPASSELNCIFNENPAACGYAIGLGIVAGLLCLLFLLGNCFGLYIYSPLLHKIICIAEFVCSVPCAALWIIEFCFLAHQWAMSAPEIYPLGARSGQTAIVFSFFSIFCWVVLSYLAFIRCRSSAEDYKHFREEDALPVVKSLSISFCKDDPVQSTNNMSLNKTPDQEMNSSLQN
ncbi:synaptogyrin-4-like isoform 1-T5 [Anomaloglossus baeobatrachus]|uniref:synaptogyrin-4-like n=1 Tax=Anomaloglossus baeobatrachus TaxID=238106 RepID=UPI003F50B226